MKSQTYTKLLVLVVIGMSLATFSSAHEDGVFWRPGDPIVPCGIRTWDESSQLYLCPEGLVIPSTYCEACDYCQILHLVRHFIDLIMIAAAPILATLFFIIAGVYMMLGGSNPGMLSQGKRIFKDTFIGLLIVMLAWLLTNTVLRTIANLDVSDGRGTIFEGGNWFEFNCTGDLIN